MYIRVNFECCRVDESILGQLPTSSPTETGCIFLKWSNEIWSRGFTEVRCESSLCWTKSNELPPLGANFDAIIGLFFDLIHPTS